MQKTSYMKFNKPDTTDYVTDDNFWKTNWDTTDSKFLSVDTALSNLNKNTNFDYSAVQPVFHSKLNPALATVMQGFIIDEDTLEMYVSQSTGIVSTGHSETYTISHLDKYGKLLDSMTVTRGGHGAIFGIEKQSNTVYIWSSFDQTDANGLTTGYSLTRFAYQAGTTINYSLPSITIYNKFNTAYTSVVTDQKNGRIAFSYTNSSGNLVVELRNISDVKSGINTILGTVTIPSNLISVKGFTIDDYNLYWRSGDANGTTYPDTITLFSFTDGSTTKTVSSYTFGHDTNGIYEGAFREPEGIYLYTDKLSGKKSLFVSVATGWSTLRISKIYALHQSGNGEMFANELMQSVQRFEMISNKGTPKQISKDITKLSDLKTSGLYYMSMADSTTYTDHPNPNVADWWLEVVANADGTHVLQKLTKNTITQSNLVKYERIVQSSGDSGWAVNFFPQYSVAVGVTNQAISANSTDTQMTLTPQGNNYPLDSGWSTSNWMCPTAGVYEINLNILINAPTGSISQAKLYVNGTLDQIMDSVPNSTGSTQLIGAGNSSIKKLIAGDVIKVYASNSASSGATIAGNYSRIDIKRIG